MISNCRCWDIRIIKYIWLN